MMLVQRGALYSNEPEGRHQQSLERYRCPEGRHHQMEMGRRFQPEKVVTCHRDAIFLGRSALALLLWALKPGGWAPLQTKGAPATSKRELLVVRDAETPNQRGAYIGKRYSVTSQRGAITG